MAAFTAQSNTMAAGDLAQAASTDGGGVSAGLARALNQLNVNLRAVVGDVRKEIVEVGSAADMVARGASDLAQRTETQAASLEQAAAAMEEFTSVLQQSGQRSAEARGLADVMATAAGEGKAAIDAVGATMQSIERASHDIAEVTALVDELAFQTNLLALNAAIEAARAGEHGRGFAVVAGEVRALAQRSTAASKNIRELVTSSLAQVDQGVVAVRGADERVQSIVQAASRLRLLIEEMAAAAAEQTLGCQPDQRHDHAAGRGHPAQRGDGRRGHGSGQRVASSGGSAEPVGGDLPAGTGQRSPAAAAACAPQMVANRSEVAA